MPVKSLPETKVQSIKSKTPMHYVQWIFLVNKLNYTSIVDYNKQSYCEFQSVDLSKQVEHSKHKNEDLCTVDGNL